MTTNRGDHILIVGSGGREHVLAWKLAQSPRIGKISVAPGNAGTPNNVPIAATDVDGLLAWALEHKPALTVVGPDMSLEAGIVDRFTAVGLNIYGPSQAAARIESSKIFAKQFMQQYGIPTASFEIFDNYRAAQRYLINEGDHPLAIKADGLAAGKGVFLTDCAHDAEMAVRALMVDRQMGDAGTRIVIEQALQGEEVSILAFCDGERAHIMPFAQDHKRALDNDAGPNTGGMGAVAPIKRPPFMDVITPALRGLAAEGIPFRGVLFAGVMLTDNGPFVLEYNCRWGDPETQAILPLLDNDLYSVLCGEEPPRWSESRHAATVIMASHGYPGSYQTNLPISGLDNVPSDVQVFHAGTQRRGDQIVTAGGRVLAVTSTGETLRAAIDRAYAGVHAIHFDGAHYRTDIGAKVL
ncbi:MAG: phosphoribosylamine--glycine ligase [Aggregatilineales bacterium]